MSQTADAAAEPGWRARLLQPANQRLAFMRLLALGFLVLGLLEWAELLGAIDLGDDDFFKLTVQQQAIVMFFAVANLVAAIGLWLTATWGVVVWISAAGARIVRHTVFAASFGLTPIATGAELAGIILFIVLVNLERRAERREIVRQREGRRNRAASS